MDAETAARNHTIIRWRDRHLMNAVSIMNDAAASVLEEFDADVAQAGWHGSWFDREGFASPRLNFGMRGKVEQLLPPMLQNAAAELVAISERYAQFSESLLADDWPIMPQVDAAAPAGSVPATRQQSAEPAPPLATSTAWRRLAGVGWSAASYAASVAQSAAEAVGSSVRDVAGIHEGLRQHAKSHLIAVWIEGANGVPSILEQVERGLRTVAMRARELSE